MTNLFTEYLNFAVFFFLNKKTEISDVLGVIFFLNKAIKVYKVCNSRIKMFNIRKKNQYSMIEVLAKISSILYCIYTIYVHCR